MKTPSCCKKPWTKKRKLTKSFLNSPPNASILKRRKAGGNRARKRKGRRPSALAHVRSLEKSEPELGGRREVRPPSLLTRCPQGVKGLRRRSRNETGGK